jgi:Holliday junction resolvasome RuvABC DNA-binding subunit
VTALTRAKGVGAKGAKKIIVELSGVIAQDAHTAKEDHQAVPPRMNQVIEGLCSLGFAADEARQAVAQSMQAHSFDDDIPETSMSTVLRESLASLGRN